jgi:mitochondrial fission protein ELM1
MAMTLQTLPLAPVWVLDDRNGPDAGQALALAGRLGLPFLRVPAGQSWRVAFGHAGRPGPDLIISSGLRNAARAIALRARHNVPAVHCSRHANSLLPFDLLIQPVMHRPAGASPRLLPCLGPLHVVSPELLAEARRLWSERLAHLPRPRIALVVHPGGRQPLSPQACARLGTRLTTLAASHRGSIMASVSPTIGRAALSALTESLEPGVHLLYRAGEPDEDPTLGFLGTADAVVVGGASPRVLSEAASADTPLFLDRLGDPDRRGAMLAASLAALDLVRPLADDLSPWPRRPLDEAGRLAREVRRLLDL